jgi:hypothetical protein
VDWSAVPHLGTVVKANHMISGLNLTDNSLGPRGAEALATRLADGRNIVFLECVCAHVCGCVCVWVGGWVGG